MPTTRHRPMGKHRFEGAASLSEQADEVAAGDELWRRCTSLLRFLMVAGALVFFALPSQAADPDTTYAFTLPSSNFVFKVTATFPPARRTGETASVDRHPRKVSFEAREGALVVFDPTPGDLGGRIGLMLTRDRDRTAPGVARRAFVVHTFRIERDPEGGEKMTVLRPFSRALYGQKALVKFADIDYSITVKDDRYGQFDDQSLLHDLTSALERDPNALSGIYDMVYSLYGPTASGCCLVDGVWVCATNIDGCGGGSWTF